MHESGVDIRYQYSRNFVNWRLFFYYARSSFDNTLNVNITLTLNGVIVLWLGLT